MLGFTIFAIAVLTALLLYIGWQFPISKKVTAIPGLPPSSKEDGNMSDVAQAGSLHEFLVKLHGRFGDIAGFWWGKTYAVSIASPELFKAHSSVFDRPPEQFRFVEPVFGSRSIQYANGADGKTRRKNYDRAFSHKSLQKYYGNCQEVADEIEKKWSEREESDHIPLGEDMAAYAFRTALLALFGEDFKDDQLVKSVNTAYNKAWSELERRLTDPTVPHEDSERQKSFKEVLVWAVYFLATHPEVQNKLYAEIIEVLGEKDVTASNFEQLRYMKQVLNESLRCAVVGPWAARVQDFDSELDGHNIPKDTPVIHALGVVLQDERLWPEPQRFDPDRFSVENSKDRSPYAFSPFGFAGKRKCPGFKFSLIEASSLIATVFKKFNVSLWEDQLVQPVFGLVTHPSEEIWIKLTKRK